MTKLVFAVLLSIWLAASIEAQSVTPTPTPSPGPSPTNFFRDIVHDQKAIWTSPFHIDRGDLKFVVPFVLVSGALIATDRHTSEHISRNGDLPGISHKVSWFGSVYSVGGISIGMYAFGKALHNDKLAETGRLAGEALIDTGVVTEVSKYAFGRLRPDQDPGGHFFHGGRSFFSGHSSASWALASVVACEYNDNEWIKVGSYAAATAMALSRLSGRNHFLSDIFVGAGVGYGIGRYVCRSHKRSIGGSSDNSGTFSWKPTVLPYFDRRTASYGGRLSWTF